MKSFLMFYFLIAGVTEKKERMKDSWSLSVLPWAVRSSDNPRCLLPPWDSPARKRARKSSSAPALFSKIQTKMQWFCSLWIGRCCCVLLHATADWRRRRHRHTRRDWIVRVAVLVTGLEATPSPCTSSDAHTHVFLLTSATNPPTQPPPLPTTSTPFAGVSGLCAKRMCMPPMQTVVMETSYGPINGPAGSLPMTEQDLLENGKVAIVPTDTYI